MIVLDASALAEILLQSSASAPIEQRLTLKERVAAPHLIDIETAQTLRRLAASGVATAQRAEAGLEALIAFPIRRYPHAPLLRRAWALRHSVSAYDAVYVALAEALDVPLLTRDARLARSRGHRADVELV